MAISITNKDEFRNTTSGWLGVVELNHEGRAVGTSVEPNRSCFLSEEEQILTANAPRDDADNPFANGSLVLVRRAIEIRNRRPYGGVETEDETGATPTPTTPAVEGSAAAGEEVATPVAVTAAPPAATPDLAEEVATPTAATAVVTKPSAAASRRRKG